MEPIERPMGTERQFQISGRDLGVAGCDEVFVGPSVGDVVEQVVDHMRSEHNIKMPDPDFILEPTMDEPDIIRDVARAVTVEPVNDESAIIVRRMRDKLDIGRREDDERRRDDLPQG